MLCGDIADEGVRRITKNYSELIQLPTFEERFRYLKLQGTVGKETFGFDRYLNQALYCSEEWKRTRNRVIARDNGCDLGIEGREIFNRILIHHINPITKEDVIDRNPIIFDLNNLIATTHKTHLAIHYGDESLLITSPIIRTPNDTCPWR